MRAKLNSGKYIKWTNEDDRVPEKSNGYLLSYVVIIRI